MKQQLLYRNVRARDHLEIFLVSAVSSLLLLRFLLSITNYPQLGGEGLHIAHMLWGGLLMMAALVIQLSFLGARVQRLSAFVGGAGFGIFIDELGKFLTKDNDYFFRPTIGLIYAIFIVLYLLFNFLGRNQRLQPREAELNALAQFEEAVLQDLDAIEKARLHRLLDQSDPRSPVTKELKQLLERIDTIQPSQPRLVSRVLAQSSRLYRHFWHRRGSNGLIAGLFVVEAVIFLGAVLFNVVHSFDSLSDFLHSTDSYAHRLVICQLASSLVAGGFAVFGAIRLTKSRRVALEYFRRAVLINLLLTEFFIFSRIEFAAIPGFLFNLVLLLALRYAIHQEHHPHQTR